MSDFDLLSHIINTSAVNSRKRTFVVVWIVWALALRQSVRALTTTTTSPSCQSKKTDPMIVACSSTTELCRALKHYVKKGDDVLELGAQMAECSATLCKAVGPSGTAILVDIDRGPAKSGRSRDRDTSAFHPSGIYGSRSKCITLQELDDWWTLQRDCDCQVAVLDIAAITGNDLKLTALIYANQMLAHLSSVRVILVKSKGLASLARRLFNVQCLLDRSSVLVHGRRSREPQLIACVGVDEYRRAIPFAVNPGDSVLEVGSHMGKTTKLLHDVASSSDLGFCIGVDIGPKIIALAQKYYPDVPFVVGDAWHTLELLKFKGRLLPERTNDTLGYDVVFADIGGLSGPYGEMESLALLDSLGQSLEPRVIVIKSLCMRRLSSRLRAFSVLWQEIRG